MIRIYLDMDLVLARFDKAENALARYETEKGFFASLEPTEFAKRIARINNTERFYILTASPNKVADADKIEWLKTHLPNIKLENVLIVRKGIDKAQFANANAILIDDHTPNLVAFENAGGKVIKATNPYTGNNGISKAKGYQTIKVF